jgi:hypothetical protein
MDGGRAWRPVGLCVDVSAGCAAHNLAASLTKAINIKLAVRNGEPMPQRAARDPVSLSR